MLGSSQYRNRHEDSGILCLPRDLGIPAVLMISIPFAEYILAWSADDLLLHMSRMGMFQCSQSLTPVY